MFTGLIHGVSDSGARGLWPYTDRVVSSPKPSVLGTLNHSDILLSHSEHACVARGSKLGFPMQINGLSEAKYHGQTRG